MINRRLNHAGRRDVLAECLVALQLGLRCHLGIVETRTVHQVHLRLVPRVVHVVAEALVLRCVVELLRIPLLHPRLRRRSRPRARSGWRTSRSIPLVRRVRHLWTLLLLMFGWLLLESLRVAIIIGEQPVLFL